MSRVDADAESAMCSVPLKSLMHSSLRALPAAAGYRHGPACLPPSFLHATTAAAVARAEQRCGVNFYQVHQYRLEVTDHESTHEYLSECFTAAQIPRGLGTHNAALHSSPFSLCNPVS